MKNFARNHEPGFRGFNSPDLLLALAYTLLGLGALSIYLIPRYSADMTGTAYIGVHIIMTTGMLIVWQRASDKRGAYNLKTLMIVAIGLRLVLLPAPFISSNDPERYLWDGAVALSGLDPYRVSPDMELAQSLRLIWPTPEEHSAYATLYPPGALAFFGMSALAGPVKGVWIWKGFATLASLLCLWVGYDVMRSKAMLRHFPLLALSPLLILEAGVGAHLDIICTLAILSALALLTRDRFFAAGCLIGSSATIKFLPLVLIGPLMVYLRPKASTRLIAGAFCMVSIIYLGAFILGFRPLGTLPVFFEKWRNGAPFYNGLAVIFAPPVLPYILGVLAVFGFGVAAVFARKGHIFAAMLLSLSVPLLLSPVVFPWYLCVLIPVLALCPSAAILGWVTVAPFGYIVLNRWISEGVWAPALWPLWGLAITIIAGLAYDVIRYQQRVSD